MTSNIVDSALRNQIHENMRLKETEELVEIWKHGNNEEWSNTALDVVKELLFERLGELPPQELETGEGLQDDKPYHNDEKLFRISFWSNILSWVLLVIYMTIFLVRIISAIGAMGQGAISNPEQSPFFMLEGLYTWANILATLATGLLYFLILQAVFQGILMLMDIEENKSK